MGVVCPRCQHPLEFFADRQAFCGHCCLGFAETTTSPAPIGDPEAATLPPEPGQAAVGPSPQVVGGYRLLRILGRGGMGTVYEAEESPSGRRVALKLVSPVYAGSAESVQRFRQEGRLASAISHPRCVFVLAADEEAGRPFIVMELMPGSTLQDLVAQQGPLPVEDAILKIFDVIDGLQAAHDTGVVHRDVKPSNCFVDKDSRVKVGDFGLSKSLERGAHLTRTGAFMGTPLYASPEQVRGERVDEQSDVYAVAATLYFLLTGRAPFQSPDPTVTLARIVSDPTPPMRGLRPTLPAELDQVVLRGLERDRRRRYANLGELRAALLPFVPASLPVGELAPASVRIVWIGCAYG